MLRFLSCSCAVLICLSAAGAQEASPSPAGGNYRAPKILTRAPISYPLLAHLNRVEGVVRVKFSIDETGHVTDAVITGTGNSMMLNEVVRQAAMRDWVFQPATLRGQPVPSSYEQEFEFKLDPVEERAIAEKRLALPIGLPEPPYPREAVARKLAGAVTIGLHWTQGDHPGLVDSIYLSKSSGSGLLDATALRFAYENWRIDPAKATKEAFLKTVIFTAPR